MSAATEEEDDEENEEEEEEDDVDDSNMSGSESNDETEMVDVSGLKSLVEDENEQNKVCTRYSSVISAILHFNQFGLISSIF